MDINNNRIIKRNKLLLFFFVFVSNGYYENIFKTERLKRLELTLHALHSQRYKTIIMLHLLISRIIYE